MKTCSALRARDSGEVPTGHFHVLDVTEVAYVHLVEDDHPFGWHPGEGLLHMEGSWSIQGGELLPPQEDTDAP